MKKHIKKKFRIEFQLDEVEMKNLENNFTYVPIKNSANVNMKKGQFCLIQTDTGYFIGAFPYKSANGNKYIPEPDPILIYFNSAYLNYRKIENAKKRVLESLSEDSVTEEIMNNLYDFFGLSSGFVIFLFTSIEAFINKSIPTSFEHKIVTGKKTEIYSKEQIERYLSFDIKITNILKEATKKDFIKTYSKKYQHIQNLKEFRDSIVHTKADFNGHTPYDYLYKKALNFDYTATINAVADFFNFHVPNYIEECPCEQNW